MSSPRTPLAIAQQLLELASDPESQVYIANESGCVGGLVSYLDYPDVEVVRVSAHALMNLASHPKNKEQLSKFPGLTAKLMELCTHRDNTIRKYAKKAAEYLTEEIRKSITKEPQAKAPVRAMIFRIEGLYDPTVRQQVERKIICIRGVVSVTLDPRSDRAVIYTRAPSGMGQAVAEALSQVKYPVMAPTKVSELRKEPQYLDDEDENELYGPKGYRTVSKFGFNTLDERLEAKRREDAKSKHQRKSTRLMSRVGRGLTSVLGFW